MMVHEEKGIHVFLRPLLLKLTGNVCSVFVTMLFKHFSQTWADTRQTFKAKTIFMWKSCNDLGLWLSFTFYLGFLPITNLHNSHTWELFYFKCLCEETECMIRVWMLSCLWFYVFTLMKKFLKLSVRNVRDANTITLELFIPLIILLLQCPPKLSTFIWIWHFSLV